MKIPPLLPKTTCLNTAIWRFRTVWSWMLLMLFVLSLPTAVQAQFTYTTNHFYGTITITGYTGPRGDVIIPSRITGLTVTTIGDHAFYFCTNLTSITIPYSVTYIGDYAFTYCENLTAITVDSNNQSYSALEGVLFSRGQSTLIQYPEGKVGREYTIPDSVTTIEKGAFANCTSLTSVTIPDSVTTIKIYAFFGCTNLTALYFWGDAPSLGLPVFSSDNNATVYYSAGTIGWSSQFGGRPAFPFPFTYMTVSGTITITGYTGPGGEVTIPSTVKGLPVTGIGNSTFQNNPDLTSVTVPTDVTRIGDFAFFSCTNLTAVHFKGDAPSVGSDVFLCDNNATVYYLPGTVGWGTTLGGRPAVLWNPPVIRLLGTCNAGGGAGVAVSGRYAYITHGEFGFDIVDISIPANCARVGGFHEGGAGDFYGIVAAEGYVYVANYLQALQVFEVSNPANCVPLFYGWPFGYSWWGYDVAVSGNYAYVADSRGYFLAFNVSNPSNCVPICLVHDVTSHTPAGRRSVVALGDRAYTTCDSIGMQIFDVRNPTNCTLAGEYITTNSPTLDVAVSGNYAYLARDTNGLEVIDVREPSACILVGRCATGGSAKQIAISGHYAYVTGAGLAIIDISQPTSPVKVGEYRCSAGAVAVSGRYVYVLGLNLTILQIDQRPLLVANSAAHLPGGGFQFTIVGATNQVLEVQASTNLADWIVIGTVTNTSGGFVDPATNLAYRFYRLRSP